MSQNIYVSSNSHQCDVSSNTPMWCFKQHTNVMFQATNQCDVSSNKPMWCVKNVNTIVDPKQWIHRCKVSNSQTKHFPPPPLSPIKVNNFTCSNAISKVKQKNNIRKKIVIYIDNQLSFYFRSLNVILFLITRRLNSPHHPRV